MYLANASDATRCKAFSTTLTKTVIKWFDSLPPKSVTYFNDLTRKFLTRFSIQKDKVKHTPSLLGVKQEVGETLRAYMKKFNKACLEVQNLPTEAIIIGLVNSLREGPFSQFISKRHPTSLNEVQEREEKYINIEENAQLRELALRQNHPYQVWDKEKEAKKKDEYSSDKPRRYHNYTPLRVSLVDIYREIYHTEKLLPPRPIKNKKGRSRTGYYEYHKIYWHSTNDCYDLKNVIEKLVKEGQLERYLVERFDNQGKRKRKREEEDRSRRDRPTRTPGKHIYMIVGGFAGGGVTKSFHKRYLKKVYQVGEEDEVPDLPTIFFTKEDAQGMTLGHDPIVITIILANTNLHGTLVDQESSANILFKLAFDKLGLEEKELRAYPDTLFEIGDTPIRPFGFTLSHTTFSKGIKSQTLSIDYIVVDVVLAYNALIGQTTLNQLFAFVSTPHLCIKFSTSEGIATIRGDQKMARRCHNESLNMRRCTKGKEVNTIELVGVRTQEELRPQPDGKIKEVQIENQDGKTTNIGANLDDELKADLVKLLQKNSDLFAWKASDIPRIHSDLMNHKLAVYPGS
ncbi:uncharacterized protein LOC107607477 [Arachis ipaensis]|uniref:uncharacterized protein LOC107607477 n=1 Tax=Arachis ipaensis TaxID=130454 RepID=UPI0007AF4F3F|nr:uncharacterized protein LOC107607477 [Arachis ipaensis]XP_025665006.1 uncharacterized protein LOC112763590 [Arachis hypogaea]